MSPGAPEMEGGCQCGAVRYAVTGPVPDAAYCHCRMCQRTSGAPAVAWGSVPAERFRYTKGTPRVFVSSKEAQRESCATCGAQLVFRKRENLRYVDFTLATLDDPARLTPAYHIWRMSRIPWFETADALPRHDNRGPDTYY